MTAHIPANDQISYPKITIADFDIPKSIVDGDSSPSPIDRPTGLATRLVDASVAPIPHSPSSFPSLAANSPETISSPSPGSQSGAA